MIPRPIAPLRRTRSPVVIDTVEIKLNSNVKNKEFDRDSLNDDDYQTPPSMFHDEAYNKDQTSPTSSTKSQTMMITIPQSTSGEQTLVKKKKKTSTKRHHHSTSSSERRRRQQHQTHSSSQREGRHTKSKPPSSSTINDLSSSSASSSSSTHSSSIVPLRKKSRPYRLASPARVPTITTTSAGKIPSISDDSLSEANEIHEKYRRRRPRSSIVSSQDQQSSSSRRSSRFESPPPATSVYLIELTNSKRPTNAYGLTKTITYVWKSSKAKPEPDLNVYPRYSIEQVPPVADHRSRRVPLPTRQILLQRGKADHWQNINLSSDSILASSCQKHTGSASNLLLTPSEARTVLSSSSTTITTNETRPRSNTAGHIISVTTTKRVGPSFLNRSKNTQWNVAGDGKQLKYSNIKWHSVDQLPQKSYIPQKHRRKQQHPVDSATDTTSSSEQHNRSAPPILQQEQSYIDIPPSPTPEIHEATNPNRMADKEQQQQTDSIVPDYPLFHREINGTSSPILSDEQHLPNDHSLSSSSSSRIVKRFATIIDEFSSPPPPPPPPPTIDSKPSQISYASTDEDVDELNSHCSEEAEPSATIQTYRDKLAARLFNEQSTGIPPPTKPRTTILDTSFRSRIFSTELSQATLDSGVDMSSEQQHQPLSYQPNTTLTIDEQSSEETADQNDLFALSDDSLLDVEAVVSRPPIASEMFSTQFPSPHIQIQRSSTTDESDEPKSYATAIGDLLKIQRGNTNTSDVYYSAESELNTSNTDRSMSADEMNGHISTTNRWDSEVYRGYELENVTDEDDPHPMKNDPTGLTLVTETMPSSPPPIPPQFNFQLPSFGDWIDQAFTAFLTENTQLSNDEPELPIITTPSQSTSSSRSSSIMSIHGSQTNFDNNSSSSNLITMIENQIQQQHVDGNILILEKNPPIVVHHRRCQSWPTSNSNELQQQQVDESSLKDMSNSSLSSDKIVDFDSYTINRMYEKINPNDISTTVVITNKRPIDEKNNSNEILSFIKRSKSLTIENGDEGEVIIDTMQSDYLPPSNSNTHLHHRIDDNDENFFLSPNPNGRTMEEEKNPADQQQQQHIEIGLDDNQHSHDSSAAIYLPYDEFEHREQKHTNSHDSLLQSDHYHHLAVNKIDTASSSTDELSTIHQLSSSAFHSKDSALGMSDENLHRPHSISFDDEIDHHQQQLHIEPIFDRSQVVVVDDNEIQDKANRNNSDDTTTTRADYISPFIVVDESSPSNNTMICVNDEPMSSSSPYQCDQTKHDERTTSSSSSEQLIPKEKQTGMYYKAFGSSAAIHLAEQYRCEWLQDVTTTTMPITSVRKSPLHDLDMVNESDDAHLRIVRQMQTIGDDEDEFYLSPQHLGPSSSCPNLVTQSFLHQRDRSYSLTTLDAYTRLDITRETLEQMWLSLLDLAFSDKDDFELGEYKLRHIMGLSGSYGNMNETLAEKSRSHGDIFSSHSSTTNPKPVSKSKSFDISSLIKRSNGSHLTTNPNNNDHDSNSANIGLLQGAAISEPFVDRLPPTITHSDTEQNFIDMDNQSIDSFEQIPPMIDDDDHEQEEETADFNLLEQILDRDHQSPTPPPATAGKEPLNYVFHYPHQTTILDNEDFELESDLSHYFPPAPPPLPPPPPPPPPPSSMHNLNHQLGEQDKQLVLSLGFDNDEATAAAETAALAAAAVQPRDTYTELSLFRPHSLSTIPSSRASQYASSVDSDEVFERERFLTKDTVVVVEYPHEQQLEENHLRISDNDDDAEEGDDERGEIESVFSSPQSRPLSSIQSRPQTPEQNQPSKPATFFDIDYDAWTRSISEPTFYEDLSVQCPEQPPRPPFNFGQNISSISVPQYIDHRPLTIDQIEPISIDEPSLAQSISLYDQHLIKIDSPLFIQQSDTNSIDSRTGEDYLEIMDVVPSTTTTTTTNMTTKMNDSTRTSLSSIHDTHLDPNELAYRLARLNTSSGTLSPPKKTLAEELAELGEHRQEQTSEQLFFEGDSLDHSPPPPIDSLVEIAQAIKHTAEIKMADTTVDQLPLLSMGENEKKSSRHDSRTIAREIGDDFTVEQTSPAHTYVLGSPTDTPNNVERLTSIANEIRTINEQNKSPSISSLCMIIEDIHARTNNQHLTGIVRHHQSLPIANLQTLVTELQQTPISKSVTYQRPQRPTHLLIESNKSDDEEELSSSEIPIPASIVSDLQQQLSAYKTVSVPPPARRVSEPPMAPIRYQTQRIDKVCDLEIVKQGNGFKIGYVDRRGTDQRVILTKRIEAGPDIMARNPAIRMPYKGRRILNHLNSAVLYTNGHNSIQEDDKFHHLGDELEVPIIGTNPQHFDESDMVSIDIDGPSTMLNSICESIVITQGSVYTSNAPKIQREKPVSHVVKNVLDQKPINNDTTRLRHVALDQHEEYLLEGSRTPTPLKRDKIEIVDSWHDRTVIEGSSTTWRSPSLSSLKANRNVQPSTSVQHFVTTTEHLPQTVQMRIAPSNETKYRTSQHVHVPEVFDWSNETILQTPKQRPASRDAAHSPIDELLLPVVKKQYNTTSTSPLPFTKVDRSCQYSPPTTHELGSQCRFETLTSQTQVSTFEIPGFLCAQGGTQTTVFDASAPTSGPLSPSQPMTLSGPEFIRRLKEQRTKATPLTVTQFNDENYFLPPTENNHLTETTITTMTIHPATLERSADSGILVDDIHQPLQHRRTKANFALQVDIKGSSSDSEDVSEATQRPLVRPPPPPPPPPASNGDRYEHHSELVIHSSSHRRTPGLGTEINASTHRVPHQQPPVTSRDIGTSAGELEQQIVQLRRERAHIIDLLALNWDRSKIWVELTEAKLNYIIGETDALLRSLSFDATPPTSESVKLRMHQYEEDMAELTRQRLAVYRERLEDSKKQLDIKIDELEREKSSIEHGGHLPLLDATHIAFSNIGPAASSHYSTLEHAHRLSPNNKRSQSFLSTSAENLSNVPIQDSIASHPHLLDVSFLTSMPTQRPTGDASLPPRYPRSPRSQPPQRQYYSSIIRPRDEEIYRPIHRPAPRYPPTMDQYDYPRYTTNYPGNLSALQGLSKSQQAILDETDKLVRDSQQLHTESASQFERARESLLSSETPIRLARANLAASRQSPRTFNTNNNNNYLPNDVTLAELFKYEQSLAREAAAARNNNNNTTTTPERPPRSFAHSSSTVSPSPTSSTNTRHHPTAAES